MTLINASLFLSGGTGFFGKSILQYLVEHPEKIGDGFRLTVLSRDPSVFVAGHPQLSSLPGLSFLRGDIRDFVFPQEQFDFIIHGATAASALLEQQNPAEMHAVIVDGTQHVLDFAARCGCRRFLMTSSGAVYGVQPPELSHIPEDFPCNPVTSYGRGKLEAEQLCIEAGDRFGFAAMLPRCFAFVGPHLPLDIHFAIGNFIRDCLDNRTITINGDGTPMRSYLYADDLVESLFTVLFQGEHARPYNVGSDVDISIADLALAVRNCTQTDNAIEIIGRPQEAGLPPRYVPSVERIRRELGIDVRVPLEEAVRRTIKWHRTEMERSQ